MKPEDLLKVGTLYGKDTVQEFSKNHVDFVKANKHEKHAQFFHHKKSGEPYQAEFFGRDILKKILDGDANNEVFGVRIYYGVAWEDDTTTGLSSKKATTNHQQKPRLFIVPVGKDGNDLDFITEGKNPGGGGGGNGIPCPSMCSQT